MIHSRRPVHLQHFPGEHAHKHGRNVRVGFAGLLVDCVGRRVDFAGLRTTCACPMDHVCP